MNKAKILSPMTDIVFKLLMGTENNKEILTDFLLKVLSLSPDEYDNITILNPFLLQEYKGDKLGILDVKLKLKSGKVLNIEVQIDPVPLMESRILFYVSKLITEQIGESDQYEKIKKVISIIITGHSMIKQSGKYHHNFGLYDLGSGVLFTDALEIHTLEVPKARKIDGVAGQSDLLDWMKFFDVKTEEELDVLATKSPAISKAAISLKKLSADEKARQLYEARLKEQRDNYAREQGARQEGFEQGIEQGLEQVAKGLLKLNMPIEQIVAATNLTEEQVNNLRNAD